MIVICKKCGGTNILSKNGVTQTQVNSANLATAMKTNADAKMAKTVATVNGLANNLEPFSDYFKFKSL